MESFVLPHTSSGVGGPVLLIILDGVGLYRGQADGYPGNALDLARAPVIKGLLANAPVVTRLQAHGTAVGMPSDEDMGNSEVGHNAMGAGRIFDQGAKLVSNAISSGTLFQSTEWMRLIGRSDQPGLALETGDAANHPTRTVHFLGLLSDGNVHSHIDHLLAMLAECDRQGVRQVRVHVLLDGRDVGETSALLYVDRLESSLAKINGNAEGRDYRIASGGGRMQITMDRYEADWSMIERGWQTHVAGRGRLFADARTAIETLRAEQPGVIDQDLPPFVIHDESGEKPAGPIVDDDIVIFFNFRGDRAIEICRAFTDSDEAFTAFARAPRVRTHFAGMMEYDGDLHVPPHYLVPPPAINRTLSEYLIHNDVKQYALSETQKYGHVTYFWNGNNSEKFDARLEDWVEIPSDVISFDQAPNMKAREITDALIQAMMSGQYRFLRINLANGDMVGHTGVLAAAVQAVECLDECVGKILEKSVELGVAVIITADHGNCDQMIEVDKSGEALRDSTGKYVAKTSHTLSPVPFILTGRAADEFQVNPDASSPGLGNIAATVLYLLGLQAPADYLPGIIVRK
jgi:2,3-bisphosphoglycerate-independent phosphoglycerate mutase